MAAVLIGPHHQNNNNNNNNNTLIPNLKRILNEGYRFPACHRAVSYYHIVVIFIITGVLI
jgi:hypothetical protein